MNAGKHREKTMNEGGGGIRTKKNASPRSNTEEKESEHDTQKKVRYEFQNTLGRMGVGTEQVV